MIERKDKKRADSSDSWRGQHGQWSHTHTEIKNYVGEAVQETDQRFLFGSPQFEMNETETLGFYSLERRHVLNLFAATP